MKRTTRTLVTVTASLSLTIGALLAAAPASKADEKQASDADSSHSKWAVIHKSRFGDVLRKTDRITYTDAQKFAPTSCDVTGDDRADMIFTQPGAQTISIVPYIPYGSDTDEITRRLTQQEGVITVKGTAPGFGKASSCLPHYEKNKSAWVIAADHSVHIFAPNFAATHNPFPQTTITFEQPVQAISSFGKSSEQSRMAVASGNKIWEFSQPHTIGAQVSATDVATKQWDIEASQNVVLAPLTTRDHAQPTLAVGLPDHDVVYALSTQTPAGKISAEAATYHGTAHSRFGSAITSIHDANQDGLVDLAIGAPAANNGTGAVAIVFATLTGQTEVALDATTSPSVRREDSPAGYVIRQPLKGDLGASLAYFDGGDQPGVVAVGRPINEEHPGALLISTTALDRDWISGQGLEAMPSSQLAWVATGEADEGDGGRFLGVVPRRGDDKLQGLLTGDSAGTVNVWTLDLSRQSDPEDTHPTPTPEVPAPKDPTAEPAVQTVDQADKKVWLGEFTHGLGGAIARGQCEVTGDGKPDIISGNSVRSEWKFDPYYADSTPTKGWLPNVTGQIQILPGGMKATTLPAEEAISINGPTTTHDPALDASIGLSVACAGDTNGDGIDDLVFSSVTMGKVWVIFGGKDLAETNLNQLSSSRGYTIQLPLEGGSGFQVARVGDVNADGRADIGFVIANTDLALGKHETLQGGGFIIAGSAESANIDLAGLDDSDPRILKRFNGPKGSTINGFSAIGDINADGSTDYALTDFQNITPDMHIIGAAWVLYGDNNKVVNADTAGSGFALTMATDASHRLGAGNAVAPAGDINKDGYQDFVIGFDGGWIQDDAPGGVALILGGERTLMAVHLDPTHPENNDQRAWILTGSVKGVGLGYAVDALIGQQGTEVTVGAWGLDADGKAFRFPGRAFQPGVHQLADLGKDLVTVNSAGPKARFGRSVAYVGDYLGDSTLAIGGDGVLDDEVTDTHGYVHSAHIMALKVGRQGSDTVAPPIDDKQTVPPVEQPEKSPQPGGNHPGQLSKTGASFGYGILLAALVGLIAGAGLLFRSKNKTSS